MRHRTVMAIACLGIVLSTASMQAHAWGDEGHEIIGLIADRYLTPAVRKKVDALLAQDTSHLTAGTTIAAEATWADKYRDSDRDTTKVRYNATRQWHFVDIEVDGGDINTACFGHPAVPAGVPASQGPARDCVVDKIEQFSGELADPAVDVHERRLALQFLLHTVGDVHQPLHASDNHDQGGNAKKVDADGTPTGTLHHYWDTEFVNRLGSDPTIVAQHLIATITPELVKAWSTGTASTWALQSSQLARLYAYGGLGIPDASGKYTLSSSYIANATRITALQLSRAGVRLAFLLNTKMQ